MKRVILIVLDSVGIGALPDAEMFGDQGSNTLLAASRSPYFSMPNMEELGLFHIDGVEIKTKQESYKAMIARLQEQSNGKDTTIGHWEIAGVVSQQPLPTYPNGFPEEIIKEFEEKTGKKVICNQPYSGTKVLEDYGKQHLKTGDLIVYTSADSVFQIAAHEEIVPVEQLYHYCEIARKILTGKHSVGRVIARPFVGEEGAFVRTANRHDYSLLPPPKTMLDCIVESGMKVCAVGKIVDIFANQGISEFVRTSGNPEGIEKTIEWMKHDFEGLLFVNLVDYDMLYGHRNDVDGYGKALTYFDQQLPRIMAEMKEEDILMITADHGCDPSTPSTDHSREYVPWILIGNQIKQGENLGTIKGMNAIGATVCHYLGTKDKVIGKNVLSGKND